MTFEYNKQFAEYLDSQGIGKPTEPPRIVTGKSKVKRVDWQSKIWRWFYGRMELTAKEFNTKTHEELAQSVEDRGWVVSEYTQSIQRGVSQDYIFHMIASGLHNGIPQLSEKTKIATHQKYDGYPIQTSVMGQASWAKMPEFGKPLSPIVDPIPVSYYQIEWQQFVAQVPSDKTWDGIELHYFVVAYDALGDCLYVDYRN